MITNPDLQHSHQHGKPTLNKLLSFTQFEREVTAERIRGKIAASKRKRLWIGGNVPLRSDPNGRTLTVNEKEAETVRIIYDLYLVHGFIREVREQAAVLDLRTNRRITKASKEHGGISFGRGHLYRILSNPIYAGKIWHREKVFEGIHPTIIEPDTWEEVQQMLAAASGRIRR